MSAIKPDWFAYGKAAWASGVPRTHGIHEIRMCYDDTAEWLRGWDAAFDAARNAKITTPFDIPWSRT